jgi:hypothetical protein
VSKNILTRDSANGYRQKQVAIDTDFIRSGVSAVTTGTQTLTVSFSSVVPSTSYSLNVTLQTSDTNPQFQPVTITAKTTSGFTVKWNANIDSVNYFLNYQTMPLV